MEANPVLYYGAPTSTGSITTEARLCDIFCRPLELYPPSFNYARGWGCEGLGASPVV